MSKNKIQQGTIEKQCQHCKLTFKSYRSDNRKFCSRTCFNTGKNKINLSKPRSEKTKAKISAKLKGRIISEEQKINHGIFMRTKFKDLGIKGKFKPCYNPKACKIIEEYGKQHGYNFQHAMNGGEYYIKELGYWVDGYDKEKNVVIEYQEKHHNITYWKVRDKKRKNLIIQLLDCKFIEIKE
jgi:protein-arginine kinase activator protein McsA